MGKLLKKTIAEALGVSKSRVSQYVALGMPTASIEAALDWQWRNVAVTAARRAPPAPARPARQPPALALADLDWHLAGVLDAAKPQIMACIAGNTLVSVSTDDARQVFASVAFAIGEWFAGQGLPDSECAMLSGSVDETDAQWIEAEAARIRQQTDALDAEANG